MIMVKDLPDSLTKSRKTGRVVEKTTGMLIAMEECTTIRKA